MPKLNVLSMARRERKIETRTFDRDGEPLTVTLTEVDAAIVARAQEIHEEACKTFIDGFEDGQPPAPFPDEHVRPSKSLFFNCAMLEQLQVVEHEQDRYRLWEWAVISDRRPRDWVDLCNWADGLGKEFAADPGKSAGAPAASSSAPRSSKGKNSRRSPSAATSSSEASTLA